MSELLSAVQTGALLRALLGEILEIDPVEIPLDAKLTDELDVDSLQQLELMTMIEERLQTRFDTEAWLGPRTVAELAEHIHLKSRLQDDD